MRWNLLIVGCVLAAVAIAVGSRHEKPFEDAMEIGSKKLAGPNAIDCGRVAVGQSPKTATDCAQAAFNANKPFRVRYDLQGIDSSVAAGVVRSANGNLYAMSFDGDPTGGGGTSRTRQRWSKELCPKPFKVRVTASERLTCYSDRPTKSGGIMSPTFEPY